MNLLTDTSKLDDLEDLAIAQQEANQWYEDIFGSQERKDQIYLAFKKGGELASELQDEIYGFTHWATYHQLEQKKYYLELASVRAQVRLTVTTDLEGIVTNTEFEYQNGMLPWLKAEDQNKDLLVTYAKLVGLYDE